MEEQVVLFISTVTDEFRTYRDALVRGLRRPGVSVEVQEDFVASGDTSLLKLDDYIRRSDVVIHLAGDAPGRFARESALAGLRERYPDWPGKEAGKQAALGTVLDGSGEVCSYTQWEAYLAVFHGKMLFVCVPEPGAPRDPGFASETAQRERQVAHLARLRECGRYPEIAFANCDSLLSELLRSRIQEKIQSTVALQKTRACWSAVATACAERRPAISRNHQHADARYYQERALEKTFGDFVRERTERGMIIVGESGMGKTTLLIHLVSACLDSGNLCTMFNSGEFLSGSNIEIHLADELGRSKLKDQNMPVGAFWSAIDQEGESHRKHLLVFIDAINEYNPEYKDRRPIDLMEELDQMIAGLNIKFNRVKFVITCRADTWARAIVHAKASFGRKGIYFTPSTESIAWVLSKFSPEEFKGAYENYRKVGHIKTEFEQLSPLAKHQLRDPFLLRLAHEAYQDSEIPRELDASKLFERYYDELKHAGRNEIDLQPFIEALIDEMFFEDSSAEAIQRTAFPTTELAKRRPDLFADLNFSNRRSLGFEARQKNVIREWEARNELGERETRIRFTYDRFAEYLLAKRLLRLIQKRVKEGNSMPLAAKAIFDKNLPRAQRDPVVHGALLLCCILIRKQIFGSLPRKEDLSGPSKYITVLKAISEIDARGQWLVSSSLPETARSITGGIELLKELLRQLAKGRSIAGKRFPVIESVYGVLKDEDYCLWLEQQAKFVKEAHSKALYDQFVGGFEDRDPAVSTAAVQYVFFLLTSPSTCAHGLAIANRLATQVKPPVQMALSLAEARRFRNLVTLMILALSEAPNEVFADAVKVAREIVRGLKLKKFEAMASLFINSVLLDYFLHLLDQLPNPIQLDALKRYFNNQDEELALFEEVLELLNPRCDPSKLTVETLKRLSQADNSFVIQMLTYVISVNYERAASPQKRAEVLALAWDLFNQEPRSPLSEYCSSLALYHINFFGRHASSESIQRMDQMASHILSKYKGRLTISGKPHSFNIIGTYGRSLHKYYGKKSVDAEARASRRQSAMQYARDALNRAKQADDGQFYLSICEELGLLGVLVQPQFLFEVFTTILEDVQALGRTTFGGDLRFEKDKIEQAKDTILQSLANTRVLYREDVDRYLLEELEKPEIYAEVATKRIPEFRLSSSMSWAFEQLTFRCLAYHYEMIGKELMQSLLEAARCGSPRDGVRTALSRVMKLFVTLSQ
jgi:hypothetical protein